MASVQCSSVRTHDAYASFLVRVLELVGDLSFQCQDWMPCENLKDDLPANSILGGGFRLCLALLAFNSLRAPPLRIEVLAEVATKAREYRRLSDRRETNQL